MPVTFPGSFCELPGALKIFQSSFRASSRIKVVLAKCQEQYGEGHFQEMFTCSCGDFHRSRRGFAVWQHRHEKSDELEREATCRSIGNTDNVTGNSYLVSCKMSRFYEPCLVMFFVPMEFKRDRTQTRPRSPGVLKRMNLLDYSINIGWSLEIWFPVESHLELPPGSIKILLLMVQKSDDHQLRLVVYPIIYKVLYIPGDQK